MCLTFNLFFLAVHFEEDASKKSTASAKQPGKGSAWPKSKIKSLTSVMRRIGTRRDLGGDPLPVLFQDRATAIGLVHTTLPLLSAVPHEDAAGPMARHLATTCSESFSSKHGMDSFMQERYEAKCDVLLFFVSSKLCRSKFCICACTCLYAPVCAYVHTHVRVRVWVWVQVYVGVCVCTCVRACVRVCHACISVSVFVFVHKCMHMFVWWIFCQATVPTPVLRYALCRHSWYHDRLWGSTAGSLIGWQFIEHLSSLLEVGAVFFPTWTINYLTTVLFPIQPIRILLPTSSSLHRCLHI